MQEEQRSYIELHVAVFLFGFTAILGDIIDLSALHIVWWRLIFTVITLSFIINYVKLFKSIPLRKLLRYCGIGVVIGCHWIAFYGSLKLSNASIALVCLATTAFFTSLIEPLITGRKLRIYEILMGIFIIPGMVLVVQGAEPSMYVGIIVGLSAAILASLFSTLNKRYISDYKPLQITAIELCAAMIFITLLVPFFIPAEEGFIAAIPMGIDWIWLIIMAVFCTAFAFYLSLRSLRHLSAFASSLTFNLEPLYGILMAIFLLNDAQELDLSFYIGGTIILIVVFTYPFINRFQKKRKLGRERN